MDAQIYKEVTAAGREVDRTDVRTYGKIAGYCRLSVEDGDMAEESNSITNQRLLIRRYLMEHPELSCYEYCEFYDDGVSGTTMERPGLRAMLEKIRKKEIQCVIVKDLSRFSRDYIALGDYMEQIFPFMGIRFISIAECYDSLGCIGKTADMEIGFQSLLADFYCRDISEKVRSALAAKKKKGVYATGNTPFGYGKDGEDRNRLRIVPEEADIIRRIFELSLAGRNLTQICRTLNDEKTPTPLEYISRRKHQNRKELRQEHTYWQPGTVRAILTNESYLGSMVFHKSVQAGTDQNRTLLRPREEWDVLEDHHPAIVCKETFDKVQEKFFRRKAAVRRAVMYALKGKTYCGYCRRRLKIMKLAGGRLYYHCPNQRLNSHNECLADSVSNELLEKIVLEEIRRQTMRLADAAQIGKEAVKMRRAAVSGLEKEMAKTETEIVKLTKSKAVLLEAYHAAAYHREEYMEARGQIERQISQKRNLREVLQKRMDACSLACAEEKAEEQLWQSAAFGTLTKEMADAVIEKIVIGNDKTIDIYWKFNSDNNGIKKTSYEMSEIRDNGIKNNTL